MTAVVLRKAPDVGASHSCGKLMKGLLQGYIKHMSHSLNSFKGGYIENYIGDYYRGY